MSEERLQVYLGNPHDVLPFMDGRADVVVVDVTRDTEQRWREIVTSAWIQSGAKRLLVVTSSQQDPRGLLAATNGPFVGSTTLTRRYHKVIRNNVEHSYVVYVFGTPPVIANKRPFMPAHHQLTFPGREWDDYHEAMRSWVLRRLVALHESVLDTNGDDGDWTRSSAQVGLQTYAVVRDEDNADALRLLTTHRYLFEADWLDQPE